MSETWVPRFYERSALFDALRAAARRVPAGDWPQPADLQAALAADGTRAESGGGAPLRFVAHSVKSARFEDRYEPRIYLRGEVQVRRENWHDFFNALVWMTFPRAKAAINARHYRAMREREATGNANRGAAEDALTLFDESGLVVAASDARLLRLVDRFAWRELFWEKRSQTIACMRFYVFGHSIYEKALAPFRGITARAMAFEVEPRLLEMPLGEQIAWIDAALAARLADPAALASTRELAPVPVLGVPGWHPGNEQQEFYEDTAYFRPGRRGG